MPCPDGLVDSLKAATDDDGIFNGVIGVRPGDAVCLVSGPLVEMAGTLVRLDGAGRAQVLLQIMHGEVAVTLDSGNLTPASS